MVLFEPAWKDQILTLQQHLWHPSRAVNSAYFEWKYLLNPLAREPLVYLAIHQDEVVGMRGFWRTVWEGGSPATTVEALGAGDLVVAPAHRVRGLFARITTFSEQDLRARGHKWLVNFSAGPFTRKGSLVMGWEAIGTYEVLSREPLAGRIALAVRRRLRRLPSVTGRKKTAQGSSMPADGIFQRLDRAVRRGRKTRSGIEPSREIRAEEMAALVERIGSDGRIREVRSPRYLDWRYQNPLGQYRFLYHGTSPVDGYMALHATREGPTRWVNIVDWEAEDDSVRERLLQAAIETCQEASLAVWGTSCSPPIRSMLADNGFQPFDDTRGLEDFRPSMLVKPLRPDGPDFAPGRRTADPESWDLRMLNSDYY
jgi:GNAT superfamily N-acetyltransferase